MPPYLDIIFQVLPLLIGLFGGIMYIDRRITKLEVLMTNHLSHHEVWETKIIDLLSKFMSQKEG